MEKLQGSFLGSYKTSDGREYIKIKNRFVYFVEINSNQFLSEVQDFEFLFEEQKEHYNKFKKRFLIQKAFKIDNTIPAAIKATKKSLEGIDWWSEDLQILNDSLTPKGITECVF